MSREDTHLSAEAIPALVHSEAAHWYGQTRPSFSGGNVVHLLRGGGALFPSLCEAISAARQEVWLATYIFHADAAAMRVLEALEVAARRGVRVRVVVDGFGSAASLPWLSERLMAAGAGVAVFRPLLGWRSWLQPEHLRRLHQKLCTVDGELGFVGGINLIDDHFDLTHGWMEAPRLDFAVQLRGPVVLPVEQTIRAIWTRAMVGRDWTEQLVSVARSRRPARRARRLLHQVRMPTTAAASLPGAALSTPMRAAFVVRDNLRQRRTIELSYIEAIRGARERIDVVSPYFYPGRAFRRVLRQAARRGVAVRLLMQGRWDYRVAAWAARALYGEMQAYGVRIFEYTPAFLHAKVAVVDDHWATVGSSNIDPLSLLLNLEANVLVEDPSFVGEMRRELDAAFAVSHEVSTQAPRRIWERLQRWGVATGARLYMRLAGITRRY